MTQTLKLNGVNRQGVIREESMELVTAAYVGEIGVGKVIIDDTAGTIVVPSWKDAEAIQSAASPSTFWKGFTHTKRIRRGKSARTLASREYEVGLQDGNDLLRRLAIVDTKKRPAETVNQRIHWLLTEELSRVGVADYGRVQSSTAKLDADKSVKGRFPVDMLAPIAKAIGFNHYVRWNRDQEGWELVFRDDNASDGDTCTLLISNVASDIDGVTTFEPLRDAELTQDAEHVYSGVYATHGKGNVYLRRAATAAAFADRDGVTEDSSIRTDTTARRDGRRFLRDSADEEQSITPVTIRVPETHVGLVEAGMRISTRLTYATPEGWDPARYARILRLRVGQYTDGDYSLSMDLSPQEGGAAVACPYDLTESGTYYPLGQGPEGDSHANPSDGVVYYLRGGIFYPVTPWPGAESLWHFPRYGVGGAGSTDFAGDCVGNELRFIVVGNGTMSIQTEICDGNTRPIQASWGPSPGGFENYLGQFTSGDVIELEIENADNEGCVSIVHISDGLGSPCGGKWGWSAMEWTAA